MSVIVRQRQVLNRHLNTKGGTEAPPIEFAVAFLEPFGEILAQVLHETQSPVLAFAARWLDVDVAVTDDGAP